MSQTLQGGELAEGKSREKEVFRRINEMRQVINQTYEADAKLTTNGTNVLTTAWTSPTMPRDGAWWFEARIIGYSTTASGSGAYTLQAGIESNSGALIFMAAGFVTVMQQEDDVTLDAQIVINGQNVLVKVKDNSFPMKWRVHISIVEVVK